MPGTAGALGTQGQSTIRCLNDPGTDHIHSFPFENIILKNVSMREKERKGASSGIRETYKKCSNECNVSTSFAF
jgi:hypothetical protein